MAEILAWSTVLRPLLRMPPVSPELGFHDPVGPAHALRAGGAGCASFM